MIEILKFEDIAGNTHHYNLAQVEDIVKKKDTGKCYIFAVGESQYEITEAEYNRINSYNGEVPNGEARTEPEN